MKQDFDSTSRADLINYRIERAHEALQEARYNQRGGYFNTAVNRLYYAVYYAASALMLKEELDASTHAGIKTLLGLKFIKTGKLDISYGRTYQQLFECRQSGDYDDFTFYDSDFVDALYPDAVRFVEKISDMAKH